MSRDTCSADRHGTCSAYKWWGCRCPDAREATRLYAKRLRENRLRPATVAVTGTARRIEALVAAGYSMADVARHLDVSDRKVRSLINGDVARVFVRTAEMVAALYEKISGTPGPSAKAREYAARRGWAPPLAWDDAAIDDPNAVPNCGGPGENIIDSELISRAQAGQARWAQLNHAERLTLVSRLGRSRLYLMARTLHMSYQALSTFHRNHVEVEPEERAA